MSNLTAFPDDLPWPGQQAFLLLDGATISDLPARLKQLDPTASVLALYDQPPLAGLREVSPLLVAIERPDDRLAQFYLQNAREEWGVLLFSTAPLHSVAEHLRKLLIVELPTGQSALLRMADAAVAHAFFASDTHLFGPLTCVVTADRVSALWQVQRPRQTQHPALAVPYRLSPEQSVTLDQVDRRRSLLDLDAHLLKHFSNFHVGETLNLRWPMLELIETRATALGLSCQSGLFNYANLTALLDGSDISLHPKINHLLQTSSLQSAGERVALAVDMAERWADQREHS